MKKLRIPTHIALSPTRKLTVSVLALVFLAIALSWISNSHARVQQGGRDELRIELTSSGFTPSEVQHAPGRFAIAVDNNTLAGEYTLRWKASDGTVLNEVQVQKGSSAWTVNLQTGTYTLTEASHADWTCRIVVQ